jgi:hypothetical protein
MQTNLSSNVITLIGLLIAFVTLAVKAFAPSIPTNIVELILGVCTVVSLAFHIPVVQASVAQAKLNKLNGVS